MYIYMYIYICVCSYIYVYILMHKYPYIDISYSQPASPTYVGSFRTIGPSVTFCVALFISDLMTISRLIFRVLLPRDRKKLSLSLAADISAERSAKCTLML